MQLAASTSDAIGTIEILRFIVEGLGAIALFGVAFVLKDLRARVMRLEDHFFGSPPSAGIHTHYRKVARL